MNGCLLSLALNPQSLTGDSPAEPDAPDPPLDILGE